MQNSKIKKHKLENAMSVWINQVCDANFILTEDILKIKSKEFTRKLGIYDFVPTNAWLYKFKKTQQPEVKKLVRRNV